MVEASAIVPHMEVLGSDGGRVGTVDAVQGDRIKLTKSAASDDRHRYILLSAVARVDDRVHLMMNSAAALALGRATAAVVPPPRAQPPAAGIASVVRNALPWMLIAVAVMLVLLFLRGRMTSDDAVPAEPAAPSTGAATMPFESVKIPNGTRISLERGSLNLSVQRYLASSEPAPRSFTFERLAFDPGSAAIRSEDEAGVDTLARLLLAYPNTHVRLVGHADADGGDLGLRRATTLADTLAAKGIDPLRTEAVAGPPGAAHRTELVVTAK